MKRGFYIIISVLWVMSFLLLGFYYAVFAVGEPVFSQNENRMLAGVPKYSWQNIWSGNVSDLTEDWLSDSIPGRDTIIGLYQKITDLAGFASYEESLDVSSREDSFAVEAASDEEIQSMISVFTVPEPETEPKPPEEDLSFAEDTELTEQGTAEESGDIPGSETEPSETEPAEEPVPEVSHNPLDYPDTYRIIVEYGDYCHNFYSFTRDTVLATTAVLNRLAAVLPEDGQVLYTVVPDSYVGNRYFSGEDKKTYISEAEALVEIFADPDVHAITSTDYLKPELDAGTYVYYRSDYHWTPFGAYPVYRAMVRAAGRKPCAFDDLELYSEEGFLGSIYRSSPSYSMEKNPDTLYVVMPRFDIELRLITSPDNYEVLPMFDFDAPKNDRYRVYLGGPNGPWMYAVCDNDIERKCLVITDSYGLTMIPMLCENYGEVHYYDGRFFNSAQTGGTVKEMIEKYGISDVYIVVADDYAYNSGTINAELNHDLGD